MLNQFTFIGRIAKDPQLQTTKDGASFTRFTLAVRRSYRNQSGNFDTDFMQCISWNKLAETIADYCTKGSMISVTGRIQMRSIELENEQRMNIPDIIAENVSFLQLKKLVNQEQQVPIPAKPQATQHNTSSNEERKTPPTPLSSEQPPEQHISS